MKRISILSLCLLFLAACATTTQVTNSSDTRHETEAGIVWWFADRSYSSPDSNAFPLKLTRDEIKVKVYRDVEVPLAGYKTFNFDYTNKTNPLLEKELFHELQKSLEARGMTRVDKNPQITISMDFFFGKKEQYTPPTTVTSTEIHQVWNSTIWGWGVGGYAQAVPITSSTTTPGYTTTTYYSNIRLNFLDHAKLMAKNKKLETPPIIWVGEADTEGDKSDIRDVAHVMFNELISEFPAKTAKGPTRYVSLYRYGGLGLTFVYNDWKVVSHVEPSSVAAKNGISPGDVLVSINGNRVGTYTQECYGDKKEYRDRDAYYQNILSNKGDKYVTVVIKKASTGEEVSLKMKPCADDRYIYTEENGFPL